MHGKKSFFTSAICLLLSFSFFAFTACDPAPDDSSSPSGVSSENKPEEEAILANPVITAARTQSIASVQANVALTSSYTHGLNYFIEPKVLQDGDIRFNSGESDMDLEARINDSYTYAFLRENHAFSMTFEEEFSDWESNPDLYYAGSLTDVLFSLVGEADTNTDISIDPGDEDTENAIGSMDDILSYMPELSFSALNTCVLSLAEYTDSLTYSDKKAKIDTSEMLYFVANELKVVVEEIGERATLNDLLSHEKTVKMLNALSCAVPVEDFKDGLLILSLLLAGMNGGLNETSILDFIELFSIQPSISDTAYTYILKLLASEKFLVVLGTMLGEKMSGDLLNTRLSILFGEYWLETFTVILSLFNEDGIAVSLDQLPLDGIDFGSGTIVVNGVEIDLKDISVDGVDISKISTATYEIPDVDFVLNKDKTISSVTYNFVLEYPDKETVTCLRIVLSYDKEKIELIDVNDCLAEDYEAIVKDGWHTDPEQCFEFPFGNNTLRCQLSFRNKKVNDLSIFSESGYPVYKEFSVDDGSLFIRYNGTEKNYAIYVSVDEVSGEYIYVFLTDRATFKTTSYKLKTDGRVLLDSKKVSAWLAE